ncbi:Nramp family divalent metal transporter [Candidatus Roizmanbacteria bacterium]|nr:Nramp family divalent metal transporter [Candidatus Roizmanbacteria bacterium]
MTHENFFESKGWRYARSGKSLDEVHRSIPIPTGMPFWRKCLAFAGPGFLVAIGYIDPGNWATDLAGGASYGYLLLSVILFSNIMAIILQHLALKLGIATGRDLAQACHDHYPKPVSFILWILAECAIVATDLAEVIGSAIALNLLFHIPLLFAVIITGFDVLLLLALQHKGFRYLEAIIITLLTTIIGCFLIELILANPALLPILHGFIPSPELFKNKEILYLAIGIIGATVMPHNLFLHSAIIQTRRYEETVDGKKEAIQFATWDSTIALFFAFLVNAAILIVAASVFYQSGNRGVADISNAYQLLTPLLGTTLASLVFGIALLASGQSSTITGTLAGQIVMEGFIHIKLKPWLRRIITRGTAIVPAIIAISIGGGTSLTQLLILSQVVLSLQLPFAIWPLVHFTSEKKKMGPFTNSLLLKIIAYVIVFTVIILNGILLLSTFH